jgi:RNA polymerase sigma-70 factor (ECF subfamily)
MDAAASDSAQILQKLIVGIARRDHAAFGELYRRTASQLFAVALRILRQRDHAEDVLQESFVAIWERAPDYDPLRGSVMSWLATIVRHRAIDHVRRIKSRPEGFADGEEALAVLAAGTDTRADRGAVLGALGRCLDQLDEQPRRAVVYAYAYGYTHEELAAQFKAPLGTIKSWIRRSLERLKLCLDG